MAKKVRRVKKKQQQRRQTTSVKEDVSTKSPIGEGSAGPQLSSTEQFRLDYSYVVKDLRRVLVLAAIMFALLIALNLLVQ